MSYISASDITDSITTGFTANIAAIILRSDNELENFAREFDIAAADIEITPLDYSIKQWCIAWCMVTFCLELVGKTGLDVTDQERYYFKWKMYEKREQDLRAKVTEEMFAGTVEDTTDVGYQTGILYRS